MFGKDSLKWPCLSELTWVTSDSDLFAAGMRKGLERAPASLKPRSLPSFPPSLLPSLLRPQPSPNGEKSFYAGKEFSTLTC